MNILRLAVPLLVAAAGAGVPAQEEMLLAREQLIPILAGTWTAARGASSFTLVLGSDLTWRSSEDGSEPRGGTWRLADEGLVLAPAAGGAEATLPWRRLAPDLLEIVRPRSSMPTVLLRAGSGAEADDRPFQKEMLALTSAAAAGGAETQYRMAIHFHNGRGVTASARAAVECLKRAGDMGSGAALNDLGWMVGRGYGVPMDLAAELAWYERAAAAGNSFGMYNVADMLFRRLPEGRRDRAAAGRWAERAAKEGLAKASFLLGEIVAADEGAPDRHARAMAHYIRAHQAGVPEAANAIGLMFQHGRGMTPDPAVAVEWYRRSAEAGLPEGMSNLAYMLGVGLGVAKDAADSLRWYLRAAEKGHSNAMGNLGIAYDRGLGVEADPARAAHWYRCAIERGETWVAVCLASQFEQGRGVPRDLREAVRLYGVGADGGDPLAMVNLALHLLAGGGTEKDPSGARRLLEKAAVAGSQPGMNHLSDLCRDGVGGAADPAAALAWARRSAEAGNPQGMLRLARILEQGAGTAPDPAAARIWYERAAALGETGGAAVPDSRPGSPR